MTRIWFGVCALGLAVLLAAGGASADDKKDDKKSDPPPPAGRGGRFGGGGGPFAAQLIPAGAKDSLKLTDAQTQQVSKLQKEFEDKVKEKTGTVREEMQKALQNQDVEAMRGLREKMQTARQDAQKLLTDYEGKVKGILTDEQKKTYETAIKDRPQGFGGIAGGFGGGGFPGAGGFGGPFGRGTRDLSSPGVQNQLNLTDEQKAKLEKLKKEFEEQSLKILTDDQKKKYDEIKNAPPAGGPGRGIRPGAPGGGNRPGRGTRRPDF